MTDRHEITVHRPGYVTLHLIVVEPLPIGRAGHGLLLADERTSRFHCELRVDDGTLTVRDTGSSNGTLVNGTAITGTRALAPGDEIHIGDTFITVGGTPPPASDEIGATIIGALPGQGLRPATLAPPPAQDPTITPTTPDEDDQLRASMIGSTITLVISDIIGSTTLVHALGDRAWLERLDRHDEIARDALARYSGTEVKGQGDGFLLTFPSARHALLFAIALQRDLAKERVVDPSFPIHVRVGIHTGEVVHAGGDVFGRHVHQAARISGTAGEDEIVASSLVFELAAPMGDITFQPPRWVSLKGFDDDVAVYPVDWYPA